MSRRTEKLLNLAFDVMGTGAAGCLFVLLAFVLWASWEQTKSEKFLELRPGLEKQCRQMLNMGNRNESVEVRAAEFNSQLARYHELQAHPVFGLMITPKMMHTSKIECTGV